MIASPIRHFRSYPKSPCHDCDRIGNGRNRLFASYSYKPPAQGTVSGRKVMLIGQDPTIRRDPTRTRVTHALMLNDPKSQLSKWLRGEVFSPSSYDGFEIYATNIVKCTFSSQPGASERGGLKFLEPFFANCRSYLVQEILEFEPQLVVTFGEPAHQLFVRLFESPMGFDGQMKLDLVGRTRPVSVAGFSFEYTPCLHISQFRTAATYGPKVAEWLKHMY